jgi:hypothetical protein
MDTALVTSTARWLHDRWDSVERLVWFRDLRRRFREAQVRIAEEKAKQETCTTALKVLEVYKLAKECGDVGLAEELLRPLRSTSSSPALAPLAMEAGTPQRARPLSGMNPFEPSNSLNEPTRDREGAHEPSSNRQGSLKVRGE